MSGTKEKKFNIGWDTQAPAAAAATLTKTAQRAAERTPAELALLQHRTDPASVLQAVVGADAAAARQAVVDDDALETAALAVLAHPDGAAHAVLALTRLLPSPGQLDEVDEDDDSELTPQQAEYRRICDGVLTAADQAAEASVWVRGWALEIVRRQRLHRKTHPTLDAYTRDKVKRSYRQTLRWRQGYPLAMATLERVPDAPLPSGRDMRELMPATRSHGQDMALELYSAVHSAAAAAKAPFTSEMLAAARQALPGPDELPGSGERAKKLVRTTAEKAVRAYVRQAGRKKPPVQAAPGDNRKQQTGSGTPGRYEVVLPEDLAELFAGAVEDFTSAMLLPKTLAPALAGSVLAALPAFLLEHQSAFYDAFADYLEHRADATGTRPDPDNEDVLEWSWTAPAGPVTATRNRVAEWPHPAGCSSAAAEGEPCPGAPTWRITRPAPDGGGQPAAEYWCTRHLPEESAPPAFHP